MKQREETFQEAVAKYMALQYPRILFFHVPNGGKRDVVTAVKLKRQGVRRGIPDCIIEAPRRGFHGLRVELKVNGNYLEPEQKEVINYYNENGYFATMVRTFDEFKQIVDEYLNTP